MNTKQLTLNKKAKLTPIIIERDYSSNAEHTCIFDDQPFIDDDPDWNLAWSHARCNQLKKYSAELQTIAHDKIISNKKWVSASLGEEEGKINKETQPNEQIDANREASQVTELYLIERLLPCGDRPSIDNELDYNDARDSITYLCYKKFRHGSQIIDSALKMITCSESPFCKEKCNGRLVIFTNKGT